MKEEQLSGLSRFEKFSAILSRYETRFYYRKTEEILDETEKSKYQGDGCTYKA